jgi:hypothetical protein
MNSAFQLGVLKAANACIRPLVRMLMRSGVVYDQLDEIVRSAFVQEALGERDSRGRKTNVSRVAIRTGLPRKEVTRIKMELESPESAVESKEESRYHAGHAARVLQVWHSDPRYLTDNGEPRALPFTGEQLSFNAIVRIVGGDLPPGAVRAELIDAGAVILDENGNLRALKRYFVPGDVGAELLVGLTHFVVPVLEGLARNTDRSNTVPFIQRLAYSDRLAPEAVPLFRHIARERTSDFVQSVDDWLASNELPPDANPANDSRVALGVFYFEGPPLAIESASAFDKKK